MKFLKKKVKGEGLISIVLGIMISILILLYLVNAFSKLKKQIVYQQILSNIMTTNNNEKIGNFNIDYKEKTTIIAHTEETEIVKLYKFLTNANKDNSLFASIEQNEAQLTITL